MNYLSSYVNESPLGFSLNILYKFKKKYLIILSLDCIEYKGQVGVLDKNFNFVLHNCLRLSSYSIFSHLDTFEVIFIRGENIINVTFIS